MTAKLSKILAAAKHLSLADKRELLAVLTKEIEAGNTGRLEIAGLQGLGKEIWKDVDIEKYVQEERASWSK